jgi:hypothetical protein
MKYLRFLGVPLLLVFGSGCYGRDGGPALYATDIPTATQSAEIAANPSCTAVAQQEWFEGESHPQTVYVSSPCHRLQKVP